MLDLVKVAAFVAVHRCGSFSEAARELRLTQPAVSRQVALLERDLGVRLLKRDRQGVRATKAGRVLAPHARAVIDQLLLAESQVRALTRPPSGRVRMGSFFSALVHLAAEAAAELAQDHPDIVIVDELVDPVTAIAQLARAELDVAVVFDHPFAPLELPVSLTLKPMFDDPLRILLPADHPLAGSAAVDLDDLQRDVWIRPHDGTAAALTDWILANHDLAPSLLHAGHGDEPVEIQALVAAGRGVALTYDLTVMVSGHRLQVVPIAHDLPARRIAIAHPTGQLTAATAAVVAALSTVGNSRQESSARTK